MLWYLSPSLIKPSGQTGLWLKLGPARVSELNLWQLEIFFVRLSELRVTKNSSFTLVQWLKLSKNNSELLTMLSLSTSLIFVIPFFTSLGMFLGLCEFFRNIWRNRSHNGMSVLVFMCSCYAAHMQVFLHILHFCLCYCVFRRNIQA